MQGIDPAGCFSVGNEKTFVCPKWYNSRMTPKERPPMVESDPELDVVLGRNEEPSDESATRAELDNEYCDRTGVVSGAIRVILFGRDGKQYAGLADA